MTAPESILNLQRPRFVAIVGGSGSGKSWLADRLEKMLEKKACRISLDDFYLDRSHLSEKSRKRINFDNPRAIDWLKFEETLHTCAAAKDAEIPQYDFASHTRKPHSITFTPSRIVLIEGLWLLHRQSVRRFFDYKVFLDCPVQLRLSRRLHRDCSERGRTHDSICEQFYKTVAPMHDRFVTPQVRWADTVFTAPPNDTDIYCLTQKLLRLLPASETYD